MHDSSDLVDVESNLVNTDRLVHCSSLVASALIELDSAYFYLYKHAK